MVVTIYAIDRNGATTNIVLETAVDNQEDRYAELLDVVSLAADPASLPANYYVYLSGPGAAGSGQPGFARYLRVKVGQNSGASITLDVKAILKP